MQNCNLFVRSVLPYMHAVNDSIVSTCFKNTQKLILNVMKIHKKKQWSNSLNSSILIFR